MTSPWQAIMHDKTIRLASLICFLGFGGFMLWSALAPLAEGVVAYGKIVSENDRKTIQHLEGGIIEDILVREGDTVKAGDPLVVLTDVAALSGRNQTAQALVNARAAASRLQALLGEATNWNPIDQSDLDEGLEEGDITSADLADILNRQKVLFIQQRQSYAADLSVLESRRNNFLSAANASQGQVDSLENELAIVRKDLVLRRQLLAEKLTQGDQVTRLERDEASMMANISRLRAQQLAANDQAEETRQQSQQTRAHFRENVNTQLVEERAKASEAQSALTAAQDVVNRKTIYAPQAGEILNLKFKTKGGVVRAGEAILEIVPTAKDVIAMLELKPSDRDVVYTGLDVNTRLSGLNSWRAPVLKGEVINVSADLKTSPRGDYQYYEARVLISSSGVKDSDADIMPGMPVEAFVVSGHSRTLFQYLWEPISGTLRRGVQG